jgi:hypothetical protein
MRAIGAFLLLLVLSSPASAGLRATYSGADEKRITVEVADNGDARIGEAGAADYGVLHGGTFYIVGAEAAGPRVVAIADIAAAIDSVVAPIFGDALTRTIGAPGALTAFRVVPSGARRTVGGEEGNVIQVYGEDAAHPDRPADWVTSAAPSLAPIGRALEGYLIGALMPDAVFRGPAAGENALRIRTIFATGTPIAGARLTLQQVERVEIPLTRVSLPAPPMSREALLAAMRSGQ